MPGTQLPGPKPRRQWMCIGEVALHDRHGVIKHDTVMLKCPAGAFKGSRVYQGVVAQGLWMFRDERGLGGLAAWRLGDLATWSKRRRLWWGKVRAILTLNIWAVNKSVMPPTQFHPGYSL